SRSASACAWFRSYVRDMRAPALSARLEEAPWDECADGSAPEFERARALFSHVRRERGQLAALLPATRAEARPDVRGRELRKARQLGPYAVRKRFARLAASTR